MRKFSSIVESTSEPSREALWLNKGTLRYYNGQGWEPICHIDEHADIIKEMGDKIDSLDKEMGDVKGSITGIENDLTVMRWLAHPVISLEIGNTESVKANNLDKINRVSNLFDTNIFQASIDYGYGVASFIPDAGGVAHVLTAQGVMVHYDIDADGSVTKEEETNIPNLLPIGGQEGQVLKKAEEGYTWGSDNDTTYGQATKTQPGLVKAGINIADLNASADLTTVIGAMNALLQELRSAGVIVS